MGRASPIHYAAALALALAGLARPARAADFDTGNQLLAACSGSAGDQVQCYAYMDGLLQGLLFMSVRDKSQMPFCVPDGVTKGQAAEVVVKYLRENPEQRHIAASVMATVAMRRAFPCAQK